MFSLNAAALADRLDAAAEDAEITVDSEPRVTEYACALAGICIFLTVGFKRQYLDICDTEANRIIEQDRRHSEQRDEQQRKVRKARTSKNRSSKLIGGHRSHSRSSNTSTPPDNATYEQSTDISLHSITDNSPSLPSLNIGIAVEVKEEPVHGEAEVLYESCEQSTQPN